MKIEKHRHPHVFRITERDRKSLATKSLVKGQAVYGEKVINAEDGDYRIWSARRSKLGAAIRKQIREMPIQPGSRVLYLGAASGTTVSHVSDIVGQQGIVYAVEFSPRTARDLIKLAQTRNNIIPIVEDARHPTRYTSLVTGPVDVVYQDVAQADQARILLQNVRAFSSFGTWAMIAIKARSIDSTSSVKEVYEKEIKILTDGGLELVENVRLDPLEKDHAMIVCRVGEQIT
ncbi:MAG: Fibrillarin-like rRNA/tRNA 2'-O-methyltransferase [Candidatus Thorarchaeota archaeon]|nr:MAG: Fibrillarin-like rRNA/tRNA 2'-O-methyltransferase [Candidatus Thorarchaeota archaeon]